MFRLSIPEGFSPALTCALTRLRGLDELFQVVSSADQGPFPPNFSPAAQPQLVEPTGFPDLLTHRLEDGLAQGMTVASENPS